MAVLKKKILFASEKFSAVFLKFIIANSIL